MMAFQSSGRPGRRLLLLCCVSLASKLLIPAGYMPAPVGDGWPVQLCPSANVNLPAADSPGAGDSGSTHGTSPGYCGLGALISAPAFTVDPGLSIPYAGQDLLLAGYVPPGLRAVPIPAYFSRAPPSRS